MIFGTLKLLLLFYVVVCVALYFLQETLLFFPDKLDKAYKFRFDEPFKEINITTREGRLMNGLLFEADSAKGLVFYLHGNAGSRLIVGDMWPGIIPTFITACLF